MKKIILFTFVLGFTACTVKLMPPTKADADFAAKKYSDCNLAQLQKGKESYEKYCNSCHGLKKPTSQTEEGWNKMVPMMSRKANKKAGSVIVDENTQNAILRYLVVMSRK